MLARPVSTKRGCNLVFIAWRSAPVLSVLHGCVGRTRAAAAPDVTLFGSPPAGYTDMVSGCMRVRALRTGTLRLDVAGVRRTVVRGVLAVMGAGEAKLLAGELDPTPPASSTDRRKPGVPGVGGASLPARDMSRRLRRRRLPLAMPRGLPLRRPVVLPVNEPLRLKMLLDWSAMALRICKYTVSSSADSFPIESETATRRAVRQRAKHRGDPAVQGKVSPSATATSGTGGRRGRTRGSRGIQLPLAELVGQVPHGSKLCIQFVPLGRCAKTLHKSIVHRRLVLQQFAWHQWKARGGISPRGGGPRGWGLGATG